ncbi:hypothetical protein ASD54_12390 [Rhizobium sp. Root149]|uniref:helix-turn-helix domain-containing protein n=1 Tax=Rhizobium sp. Root149 TaxID=1736473 RepID=UPI000713DD5C|nr:helix-turn-helix domain-containing protein [Rhizobium sp. Root149]KQZ49730.1 hypothetical protein ASD54_12390 [Rhizobium sp. Root149]
MNALVSISYEDRLKADIRARRSVLFNSGITECQTQETRSETSCDDFRPYQAKVLVRKPRQTQMRDEQVTCDTPIQPKRSAVVRSYAIYKAHDAHYHAWLAWRSVFGLEHDHEKHFQGLCILAGVSRDEVRSQCREKSIVLIRVAIARSMAYRFPNLMHKVLASLMDRDRSTVSGYFGGAQKVAFSPYLVRQKKISGSRIPIKVKREIVRRYRSGQHAKVIAKRFGIDISTVYEYSRLEKQGKLP